MKSKKKLGIFLACAMFATSLIPEKVNASMSVAKIHTDNSRIALLTEADYKEPEFLADNAHTALLEKYEYGYAHNRKYKESDCALYDINQDGIDELFIYYKKNYMYTYEIFYYDYSGEYGQVRRIKKFTDCDPIKYNEAKKQIEINRAASYTETTSTLYTFTGKKLKKVVTYSLKSSNNGGNRYYKNGRRISARASMNAAKKTSRWKTVNDLA